MRFSKSTSEQTDAKISDQLKTSEEKVSKHELQNFDLLNVKDGLKPKVQDANLLKYTNISKIFFYLRGMD